MDKEMKNGMRELSMDEMDKVSGGAFTYDRNTGMCSIDGGAEMTPGEFNNIIYTIARNSNTTAAIEFLINATSFRCTEMHDIPGVATGNEGAQYMGIIMDRFWRVYGEGSKY